MEGRKSSSGSSWPWRRKSSQTLVATASSKSPVTVDSPPQPQSPTATSQDLLPRLSSEGTIHSQQSDEVPNKPNYERRSQSMSETILNKNLVQQHAKIAEEAVSGWQKAESEAARYKKQLGEALQEKADLEDGFQKCRKEMSMVRQEQQRAAEDAVLKSKEWENIRAQMESKLAEVEHQLVAAEAENSVVVRSLQERDSTIAKLTQAKDKADAEVRSLYIKTSSLLKENSRLKYEVHLLNKEQEVRIDEREYRRMAAEISHKKQLQSTNQISKMEEESQRLRELVRKKTLNSADSISDIGVGGPSSSSPKLPREISVNHDIQANNVLFIAERPPATLECHLEILRSASSDLETNLVCKDEEAPSDADEVSFAQSWASAMIAELAHFRKDKALVQEPNSMDLSNMGMSDYLTEVGSMASCSEFNKTDDRKSLKQEIEFRAAAGRKQWSSKYEKDMIGSNNIGSRFCASVTEIVKLVKSLAHPLLYTTTKPEAKKGVKGFPDTHNASASELSESDLQLHIEKLVLIKDKAVELRSATVSWVVVDFLEELSGVLNRLLKILLYRNAQRDGFSDDDFDDNVSDISGLATSVSQQLKRDNFAATANNLSFNELPPNSLGHHFFSSMWKNEEKSRDLPLRKKQVCSKEHGHDNEFDEKEEKPSQIDLKRNFNRDTAATSIDREKKPTKKKEIVEASNGRRKQAESPFGKRGGGEEEEEQEVSFVEKEVTKDGVIFTPRMLMGGQQNPHPHPSQNSKHLITPHNPPSSSSSSKFFDFNSKYLKTAIRSTISKTMSKSNVSSTTTSLPHSKPSNKLLNRLLSFS